MTDAEQGYAELVRSLAETLDVDAGLRSALAAAAHQQVVADLSGALDRDAGLAAILPPAAARAQPSVSPSAQETARSAVAMELELLSPRDRIVERSHPAVLVTALDAAIAVVELAGEEFVDGLVSGPGVSKAMSTELVVFIGVIRRDTGYVASMIYKASAYEAIGDRPLVVFRPDVRSEFIRELGANTTALRDFVEEIHASVMSATHVQDREIRNLIVRLRRAHDGLQSALVCVRELERLVERASSLRELSLHRPVLDACRRTVSARGASLTHWQVMGDVQALDAARNDFTGADLRGVQMERLNLEGIRWSASTRWPAGWIDDVRRDSVEIAPGVYEIRPGTADVLAVQG